MEPTYESESNESIKNQWVADDPWKHRSSGMRCKTCIWFAIKEKPSDRPYPQNSIDVGRCRRHAPTMGGYPVVFVNDWCGDHRIDESKI